MMSAECCKCGSSFWGDGYCDECVDKLKAELAALHIRIAELEHDIDLVKQVFPDYNARDKRQTKEIADLTGIVGELLTQDRMQFPDGLIRCKHCGELAMVDRNGDYIKACDNPQCPAVRARAMMEEKP